MWVWVWVCRSSRPKIDRVYDWIAPYMNKGSLSNTATFMVMVLGMVRMHMSMSMHMDMDM